MRAHAQKRAHALGTDLGNRILLMILLSWSSLSHSSSSGRRPHARAHTGTHGHTLRRARCPCQGHAEPRETWRNLPVSGGGDVGWPAVGTFNYHVLMTHY